MPKQDSAERTDRKAGGEGRKAGKQRHGRIAGRKEQRREKYRKRAVEEKIVDFNQRSNRRGRNDETKTIVARA
jgi:hypothetical protein